MQGLNGLVQAGLGVVIALVFINFHYNSCVLAENVARLRGWTGSSVISLCRL